MDDQPLRYQQSKLNPQIRTIHPKPTAITYLITFLILSNIKTVLILQTVQHN